MAIKDWINKRGFSVRERFQKMMKCIWSGQQIRVDDTIASSESLATRDYSVSGYSSRPGEMAETKVDNSNIEEAESSLRESGYLNYEEARALLGRLEYQKGNIEAALHVFEGIDVAAVTSKMKVSLARRCEQNRRRSQSDAAPAMSMHAVSLLLEAIFLKAKSLQHLGRFGEAAQSCKVILDNVESALPEGLSDNYSTDCKLQEILNKAVELLPELWKLAGDPQEAILSYRRALLYYWNLDMGTKSKLEKEFAVLLLYSGADASPPNLRSQMEGSFVPRNNIEEAILLLLVLLRKFFLKRIGWDPSILDHLAFALSVSGELRAIAHQVEELHPEIMNRKERYSTLALCYYGEGEDIVALNLLRNLLNSRDNPDCILELLLASKICGENMSCIEEGISWARKALSGLNGRCGQMVSKANCLLGVLLSSQSRLVSSDSERILKQSETIEVLETAEKMMTERDPYIVFHLCLENAEQRKLDVALYYAKQLLKLEAGSSVKGYVLLARILSAQKQFVDAETVINAALDQSGKWDQGELLRTKAKLQIAQNQLKNAVETYTHLLAVLQVQYKSSGAGKKLLKTKGKWDRSLEMETWHDLANVYTSLSQWRDAEVCLSKSKAISPFSASRWYSTGLLNEAKGFHQEALRSYRKALDVEPTHVPSLISTACILRQLGGQSMPIVRSFLTDAVRLDRTNPAAWYNLGLLYKADASASALEAAECFEAAALLEESAPIEPFR
ncbi:No pollen germination related 2 isoform 1 [Theobroma cacao]|uniref:No pollen germination related 2 isoform 1 n=1 Tax=Theobroma cacao TaxID=3641 RepID=A0A061EV21_THECC|nr:No pollen germination related 2 isoform 1 [Theobroma cacao]EOY06123.1 No pollen germination related 2 isoform 1 [Theobroma cacao]EOY06124.1 No pollen germination related 2 isoform 1 [Theobroma cacao]